MAPSVADAQSGIQQTPDSQRYLINKFVPPNEQWAITFNLADQTATGNVFKTDGGDPAFIWCQITSTTPAPTSNRSSSSARSRTRSSAGC